jgi:hypothetical protein
MRELSSSTNAAEKTPHLMIRVQLATLEKSLTVSGAHKHRCVFIVRMVFAPKHRPYQAP